MEYIRSQDFALKKTAVALGKFEGIHRGHQLLIDKVKNLEAEGYTSVVYTFDRPPKMTLESDETYLQIYTKQERERILAEKGVSVLIEQPFTKEFAALSPERFIREVLAGKAGARVVVVGTDFHFGKNRAGNVETLADMQKECGYRLIILPKLQEGGKDISSTRIRACIAKGDMDEAALLLGRPFALTGPVVHGREVGRKLDFPTVNQKAAPHKLLPSNGVYVSRVHTPDGVYEGMTNVGVRPTFADGTGKNVETHLLAYDGDLYDREITVEFLHHQRPELRFDDAQALQMQLRRDEAQVRAYFQNKKQKE